MKECPFCGSKRILNKKEPKNLIHPLSQKVILKYYAVWCSACGTCGPHGVTREQAEKLWNKRKASND